VHHHDRGATDQTGEDVAGEELGYQAVTEMGGRRTEPLDEEQGA